MTVETLSDWRSALADGRFEEALRLYILADAPSTEVRQSLALLADVTELVREKGWSRIRRRFERLEERAAIADWSAIEAELQLLTTSSQHLDRHEFEQSLELLDNGDFEWFAAEAANQRGTALTFAGEAKAARVAFEEALELDPRHFRALTNLGNARLESGEVDEAIDCYQRALAVNEEFSNALHNLGVAYRRKGQVGESVRHLRRAQRVQQRTERERSREALGESSAKSGLKLLRWSFYALIALVAYLILRGQGVF